MVNDVKNWTHSEETRLRQLIGSGTHLRNVALILNKTYKEVEKKMIQLYASPSAEDKACVNCGRSGYCHKQHLEGCGLKQWKSLTPKQIKERILMETRKDGLGFLY